MINVLFVSSGINVSWWIDCEYKSRNRWIIKQLNLQIRSSFDFWHFPQNFKHSKFQKNFGYIIPNFYSALRSVNWLLNILIDIKVIFFNLLIKSVDFNGKEIEIRLKSQLVKQFRHWISNRKIDDQIWTAGHPNFQRFDSGPLIT